MKTHFTRKDLERLLKEGKIQGWTEHQPSPQKVEMPKQKKGEKIKGWIKLNLSAWCEANKLTLEEEYKFHPERKWRADFYIKELNWLGEYEGVNSTKSRHTTHSGYTGDSEKYNSANALGFKVFRYTYLNYQSIINDLDKILNNAQN